MKKLLLLTVFILFGSSWSLAQSEQSSAQPPSGMSEIQAYSIFYENYKSESYEMARQFGGWIWKNMPETIEGYSRFDLNTNLERLVTVYSGLAENEQDPSLKEAYIDTALLIAERSMEKFSDDSDTVFEWHIKRGRLYQTHSGMIDNSSARAAEEYLQAFEMKPEEFTKEGDGYYIRVLVRELANAGKKDQALAVMDKAEPYGSSKVQNFFNDKRGDLFDSPEERITFLEEQRKENPEDEEILTQLRDLYQDEEMTDEAREVGQKLYELNPNFENTKAVADAAISNANYDMAIKYLKEAMDKASEDRQRADIALEISDAYLNKEELQSAREFAREAMEYDSDWGKPYIQVADIYARAVSQCTSDRKMDRKDKVVYWLVLDYLDKAKGVDSSTSNEVSRKYKSYEPVTPTTEEKFFWQPPLEEGDKFEVDASLMECYGWINETTTVR